MSLRQVNRYDDTPLAAHTGALQAGSGEFDDTSLGFWPLGLWQHDQEVLFTRVTAVGISELRI